VVVYLNEFAAAAPQTPPAGRLCFSIDLNDGSSRWRTRTTHDDVYVGLLSTAGDVHGRQTDAVLGPRRQIRQREGSDDVWKLRQRRRRRAVRRIAVADADDSVREDVAQHGDRQVVWSQPRDLDSVSVWKEIDGERCHRSWRI